MNPGIANPDLLEPAGPTDPQLSFLAVQNADGKPLALLANYSLHYVGGVGPSELSADYYGVFADRIQQLLGADRQDALTAPDNLGSWNNLAMSHLTAGRPAKVPEEAPHERK